MFQVFCELERVLDSELDFRAEAQAMEKIAAGVAHTVEGRRAKPPIVVPRPVPGLCSGRVLVMEYVQVGFVLAVALWLLLLRVSLLLIPTWVWFMSVVGGDVRGGSVHRSFGVKVLHMLVDTISKQPK